MRRLALLLVLAVSTALSMTAPAPAAAHAPRPGWPITVGERGQRVCDVLTLLHGYTPSRFHGNPRFAILKGPIPKPASACVYTRKAARATSTLKYRLGYNKLFLGGQFGRKLYRYTVKGPAAVKRTEAMLVVAGKRVTIDAKAAAAARAEAAKVAWVDKLIAVAMREVGVHESYSARCGTSSNSGPRVLDYQSATGAYCLAWCMSFEQRIRQWSGMNTIASRSAAVFYVVGWARNHGLAGAVPHPGYLAAFVDGLGHIGLVYKVDTQGYWTIEGNHNDSVQTVFHPHHSRSVIFIAAGPDAPSS